MNFTWGISKATDTHTEYVIFIIFLGNSGYANATQKYVKPTLPVFLSSCIMNFF
jgi:hypothetical protein